MRRRAFLQLLGASAVGVGCAAPTAGAPAPSSSQRASAPAAAAPAAAGAPAAPARPAPPAQPIKVTPGLGRGGHGQRAVTIAREKGFFADEGIDLDWQLLQGGSVVAAGLSSGNIQFGDGRAADVVALNARGLAMVTVVLMTTRVLFDVIVRKDFATARGVTPASPLVERIQAPKGAKMGVSSLGGSPDRLGGWLMTRAGLSTDDVDNNRVGGTPEIRTAMRQGLIDGALSTPPAGPAMEQEGVGIVLIPYTDVPEWQDFPYALLYTPKPYAEQNPDAVARMVRAVVRGARFIREQPAESKVILQAGYKDVDPQLLGASVDRLTPAYTQDGRMTEAQWATAMDVLVGSGAIARALDPREGGVWTNQYLSGAAAGSR